MTGKNRGKALKDGSEVAETADVAPHQENDRRGSVGLHAVDCLEVVVIADNYYDSSRPDVHVAKRYRSMPGKSIHAEHGFSCYLAAKIGGETHRLMFDFGLDPRNVVHNMDLLAIDLNGIGAF